MPENRLAHEMACNCLMGRARLLARVLTGIYEEQLRPFGLKASQLNLLMVVAQAGPLRRSEIGRVIHLDASTLTRNLPVMLSNGWIEEVQDRGRPGLALAVTKRGGSAGRGRAGVEKSPSEGGRAAWGGWDFGFDERLE